MNCLLYVEKGDELKAEEDKEQQQDNEEGDDDDNDEEVQDFFMNYSFNFC